jgi:hypothetical protein
MNSQLPKSLIKVILIIILLMSSSAMAQLIPRGQVKKAAFGIEYIRNRDYINYTLLFDFWARLSDKTVFVADLPIAHYDYYHDYLNEQTGQLAGNVYLGLDFNKHADGGFGEVGIRLPTASDKMGGILYLGSFSDINRHEAFYPNIKMILSGAYGYNGITPTGISTRIKVGPTIMFTDKDYYSKSAELFLHYHGSLWYEGKAGGVGAGISGLAIFTESHLVGSSGSKNATQLDIGGNFNIGISHPGIQISFPLTSNLERFSDYMLKLNFITGFE